MLVLSRKLNEAILIDGDIRITVVGIRGNQVRLGIEAPERVRIFREELCAGADHAGEVPGPSAAVPRTGCDDGGPALGRPGSSAERLPTPIRKCTPRQTPLRPRRTTLL